MPWSLPFALAACVMTSTLAMAKEPSPDCSNVILVSEDWPPSLACAEAFYSCEYVELSNQCGVDIVYQSTGLGFTHTGTLAAGTDTGMPVDNWVVLDLPLGPEVEGETYTLAWWAADAPKTTATFTFQLEFVPGSSGRSPLRCGCRTASSSVWWMGVALCAILLRRRRATPSSA